MKEKSGGSPSLNKKIRVRALCLILAVLWLISALAGCGNGKKEPEDTEAGQTPEPVYWFDLLNKDGKPCTVYYPENADSATVSAANQISAAIETLTGEKTKAKLITLRGNAEGASIFVGKTGCAESNSFFDGLLYNDYGYAITANGVLCVGGNTADNQQIAYSNLIKKLKKAGDQITDIKILPDGSTESGGKYLSSGFNAIERGEYKTLTINGVSIREFTVICGSEKYARGAAEKLVGQIAVGTGYVLPICDDGNYPYEIHVGNTGLSLTEAYYNAHPVDASDAINIIFADTVCAIIGTNSYALENACSRFSSLYLSKKNEPAVLTNESSYSGTIGYKSLGIPERTEDSGIRVVANNILMYLISNERRDAIEQAYRLMKADIIMLEEVNYTWHGKLDPMFASLGYEMVPTKGESNETATLNDSFNYTPIYYRPDKLTLKECGFDYFRMTKADPWINDGTSKSYCWAMFEEKATGKTFIVCNTHMTYQKDAEKANLYRTYDAEDLVMLYNRLQKRFGENIPFILMGDLNSKKGSEALTILEETFRNARFTAKKTVNMGYRTAASENFAEPGLSANGMDGVIDHCLYSKTGIQANYYEIVVSPYTWCYSDHQPQVLEFTVSAS